MYSFPCFPHCFQLILNLGSNCESDFALKVSHESHILKSHVCLFVLLLQTITLSGADVNLLQLITINNVVDYPVITMEFYDF